MNRLRPLALTLALVLSASPGLLPSASAQTRTILYSFPKLPVNNDGANPASNLIQALDRNFYGTTSAGGPPGLSGGTIFKMTPTGTITILHSFGDGTVTSDGYEPESGLVQAKDGNFYGTTYAGGTAGLGTIFKMTPTGTVTILHSFTTSTAPDDGAQPLAGLVQGPDDYLYGTTVGGGLRGGGTVFRISPSGYFRVLHSFSDDGKDGYKPQAALLVGPDNNLYGTTSQGGTTHSGTIFKITEPGVLTILHNFNTGHVPNDGTYPVGALVLGPDGDFYSTTFLGGTKNRGTVFKVTLAGAETIVHNFGDGTVAGEGLQPDTGLYLGLDGNFYGTTSGGGGASASGTFYRITPAGVGTVLHTFGTGQDGSSPASTVVEDSISGIFYGTTYSGGTAADGTVFDYTSEGVYAVIHSFREPLIINDGKLPAGALVLGPDGNFYGITTQSLVTGPKGETGTIFQITRTGIETVLHFFGSVTGDGTSPNAPLFQKGDGFLYGTTQGGGAYGAGIAFKISPEGDYTILHSFGAGTGGKNPTGNLFLNSNGDLAGSTSAGGTAYGTNKVGVIYELSSSGAETDLYSFSEMVTGNGASNFLLGSDGNFYGTLLYAQGGGLFVQITPAGKYKELHAFGYAPDGGSPEGNLVNSPDSTIYGTTAAGGTYGGGIFYKITYAGVRTILHNFGFSSREFSDGATPVDGLTLLSDGNLGGTTSAGGSTGAGTVFEVTPKGTETVVSNFADGAIPSDGTDPNGTVVEGADGMLYGTTLTGGAYGNGTVYKVEKVPQVIYVPYIKPQYAGTVITKGLTASSNLPVAYTVISGPATLTPQGLSLTGPGTVVVQGSQVGDAHYAPAPTVTLSFTVLPQPQ